MYIRLLSKTQATTVHQGYMDELERDVNETFVWVHQGGQLLSLIHPIDKQHRIVASFTCDGEPHIVGVCDAKGKRHGETIHVGGVSAKTSMWFSNGKLLREYRGDDGAGRLAETLGNDLPHVPTKYLNRVQLEQEFIELCKTAQFVEM